MPGEFYREFARSAKQQLSAYLDTLDAGARSAVFDNGTINMLPFTEFIWPNARILKRWNASIAQNNDCFAFIAERVAGPYPTNQYN